MLYLHNTLTRAKEEFKPIDPNHIKMYVCGPTVYDFAHLGNARAIVVFDTLYRLLQRHYPQVTYARNITDVDDKIMAKAAETGESIETITTRTTQAFHDDMAALNALPPTVEPRATQYIGEMIDMIKTLIKKGHAYVGEGHVLFNVPSMPDYGQLSRSTHDELIAGARVDIAPYKKDATDFVLWKPSTKEQVGWDSPWGRGRPGWHIECSAMAAKNLGEIFDIHGGGLDLRFPHHENEIAQSRCVHGTTVMANYWLHNGFLMANGEKMSKSLGNFYTVRDLLTVAPGEALRLALLSSHYAKPLDFSIEALQAAKAKLDKWYGALRVVNWTPHTTGKPNSEIEDALLDDLNTPLVISHIDGLVKHVHARRISQGGGDEGVKNELLNSAHTLGLLQQSPEEWFRWQPAAQTGPTESEIEAQITARLAARQAKNYAESDRIRDALAAQGVILEDAATGTTWRRG